MVGALWRRAAAQAQVELVQVPTCAQGTVPEASSQAWPGKGLGQWLKEDPREKRRLGLQAQAPQSKGHIF